MRSRLRYLSESEREQIHEHTVDLLERVGVRVDSERGRGFLCDAGATLDAGDRVRIPRAVLDASLRSAPKEFSLGRCRRA